MLLLSSTATLAIIIGCLAPIYGGIAAASGSSSSINGNMSPPRFIPNLAEVTRPTGRCVPQRQTSALAPDFREPMVALIPFTWSKDSGNIDPAGADGRNMTSLCQSSNGDVNHCALCNGLQLYSQSSNSFSGGTPDFLVSTFFPINTMQRYTAVGYFNYFITTPWSVLFWTWNTGNIIDERQIPASQRATSGQWYYSSTISPQFSLGSSNQKSIVVFQEKADTNGVIVEARALQITILTHSGNGGKPYFGTNSTVWTSGAIACNSLADLFTVTTFQNDAGAWFVSVQNKKLMTSSHDEGGQQQELALSIIDAPAETVRSCSISLPSTAASVSPTMLPLGRFVVLSNEKPNNTPRVAVLTDIDSVCVGGKVISNFTSVDLLSQLTVSPSASFVGMTSKFVGDSALLVCTVSSSSGTYCSSVMIAGGPSNGEEEEEEEEGGDDGKSNSINAAAAAAIVLPEEFGLPIISVANAINTYQKILEHNWFLIQGGTTNKFYGVQAGQQKLAWTAPAVWKNLQPPKNFSSSIFVPLTVQQVYDQVIISPAVDWTVDSTYYALLEFNGVNADSTSGLVVSLSCTTGQYTSIRSAPGLGFPGTVIGPVNAGGSGGYDTNWNQTGYVLSIYTGVNALAAGLLDSKFITLSALSPDASSSSAPANSVFVATRDVASVSSSNLVQSEEMLYVTNLENKLTAVNLSSKAIQWATQGPSKSDSVWLQPPLVESKDYLVATFSTGYTTGKAPKRHLIQIYERSTGYTQTVDLSQQGGQNSSPCAEVGVGRSSNYWSANYDENVFFTYSPHSVGCFSRIKVKKVSSFASAFTTNVDQFALFPNADGSGYSPNFFTVFGSELFFQLGCSYACSPSVQPMMKISIKSSATWSKSSITKQPQDFEEDQTNSHYQLYTVVEAYGYLYAMGSVRLVCIEKSSLKPLWVAHIPTYNQDSVPQATYGHTPNYFWNPAGIIPFNGYVYVTTTPGYSSSTVPTSSVDLWLSKFAAKYDGQDKVGTVNDVTGDIYYPPKIYTDVDRLYQNYVFDINSALGSYTGGNSLPFVRYFNFGELIIINDSGYTKFNLLAMTSSFVTKSSSFSSSNGLLYAAGGVFGQDTGITWVLKFDDQDPSLPNGLIGNVKNVEAKAYLSGEVVSGPNVKAPAAVNLGPSSMYPSNKNALQKIFFKAGASAAVIPHQNLITFYDVPASKVPLGNVPAHQSTSSASNAQQSSVPLNPNPPATPIPPFTFTPINFDDGDVWIIGPIMGGLAFLGGMCFVVLVVISRRNRARARAQQQQYTTLNAAPLNQQQPVGGIPVPGSSVTSQSPAAPMPAAYGNQQALGYAAAASESQPLNQQQEGAPSVQAIGGDGVKEV